ncbi:MAG: SAM-dependent chlorinase/fluorinase [Bacteroidia bacterium]
MAIITLTTDLGLSDYYVSAVKGSILRELPDANIIDITHDIPKFDRMKAGYMLRNAFRYFPKGTIHVIGVESLEDEQTPHIAIKAEGHYFIGADTGVFSLILKEEAQEVVQLNFSKKFAGSSFPMEQIFVPAACHLARGGTLQVIGRLIGGYRKMLMPAPTRGESHLGASIQFIDSYGNIITNITKNIFDEAGKGLPFEIILRSKVHSISRLAKNYNDVAEGELLALFNAEGHLEISLNRGSAAKLLGLKVNESLRVEFHADKNR